MTRVGPRARSGQTPPAYAGATHTGLVRSVNEDASLLEPPLFAVADGLGGHQAGEVASRVAIEALLAEAPRSVDARALARAVRAANRAVIAATQQGRERTGMGTTLTAVMVDDLRLAIAHVGDSRAYLLHGGRLERLTEDHSMVADMVRRGQLTEQEAWRHPHRSIISRALGSDPDMAADVYEVEAGRGDRLLLCTDGLTGLLPDARIEGILGASPDPEAAVRDLVAAALDAGGHDNVTVIVVDLGTNDDRTGPKAAGRRAAARLLWAVAALALVAVGSGGAYAYARSRAYLVAERGRVAVYRGLQGRIAGLSLSWLVERTDVRVETLDPVLAARLTLGVPVDGVAEGLAYVEAYREPAATGTP